MRSRTAALGLAIAALALPAAPGVVRPAAAQDGGSASDQGVPAAPEIIEDTLMLLGRVEVAETDARGRPHTVAIADPVMGRYVVVDAGPGRSLKGLLGEVVSVMGTPVTSAEGPPRVLVQRFQLTEGE